MDLEDLTDEQRKELGLRLGDCECCYIVDITGFNMLLDAVVPKKQANRSAQAHDGFGGSPSCSEVVAEYERELTSLKDENQSLLIRGDQWKSDAERAEAALKRVKSISAEWKRLGGHKPPMKYASFAACIDNVLKEYGL